MILYLFCARWMTASIVGQNNPQYPGKFSRAGAIVYSSRPRRKSEGWRFMLDDAVWQIEGVHDVTQAIKPAASDLDSGGLI